MYPHIKCTGYYFTVPYLKKIIMSTILYRRTYILSFDSFIYEKRPVTRLACFSLTTNRLIVTPTHDAYLDNGTDIGLTVGSLIIAYSIITVNILENFNF